MAVNITVMYYCNAPPQFNIMYLQGIKRFAERDRIARAGHTKTQNEWPAGLYYSTNVRSYNLMLLFL